MRKLTDLKIMPIFPMAPVADPQISPDGAKILFTYSEVNMKKDKYDTQIWSYDLENKKPTQFTYAVENASNPRWSPDGKHVLFTSTRPSHDDTDTEKSEEKKPQIFVIPADGGEARQITRVEEAAENPAWAPDGKTVLFSSMVHRGEKVEDSDVKIIRRIRYKYDGKGFFQGKRLHLFTASAKGGKTKQITDGEYDVDAAAWSPDSKQIAFITNMDMDADLVTYKNIYVTTAEGGEPTQIWRGEGPISTLSWSPDGKHLAFTGRVIEDPDLIFYRNTELFILPLDGGKPRLLTGGFDRTLRRVKELKWSPDSKHIYFTYPDKGSTQIGRAHIDGTVKPVTEGKMSIDTFTVDASGETVAYNASSPSTPYELWIQDTDGARQATTMNRKLLQKLRLSPPEEFWFTASDGEKIQGWIIKPHNIQEDKKIPHHTTSPRRPPQRLRLHSRPSRTRVPVTRRPRLRRRIHQPTRQRRLRRILRPRRLRALGRKRLPRRHGSHGPRHRDLPLRRRDTPRHRRRKLRRLHDKLGRRTHRQIQSSRHHEKHHPLVQRLGHKRHQLQRTPDHMG